MFPNLLIRARQTRASHRTAAVRIALGLLFLSTGGMKFAVPELRAAFSGQLAAAGIPFHALNIWLVSDGRRNLRAPRCADPTLFPLQPEAPMALRADA
jgi:hypothetical protein